MGLGNSLQTAQAAAGGGAGVGGWVELARTTLGGTADLIDVTSFTDKRYYMILSDLGRSGAIGIRNRVGTTSIDTGSNYARRLSDNGASDSTAVNGTFVDLAFMDDEASDIFQVAYASNLSGKEKLFNVQTVGGQATGSGSAPNRGEGVFKWANTSAPMQSWRSYHASSGDYTSGSEVVVLGWDPADTHTSNFWEELASVDLSGGAANLIDSGTFTAKKYLWIQLYVSTTGGAVSQRLTFNSDTGTNYAQRKSFDGGSDTTSVNSSNIDGMNDDLVTNSGGFTNMFIINNSANEKLGIGHTISQEAAGAGTAPTRDEEVFKWVNTSSQITRLTFTNNKAGDMDTTTTLKVWGSD